MFPTSFRSCLLHLSRKGSVVTFQKQSYQTCTASLLNSTCRTKSIKGPIVGIPLHYRNQKVPSCRRTDSKRTFSSSNMTGENRKKVMLLGRVVHAHEAFDGLGDVADLVRIESGTREGLMREFREGKHDGVVAIWWTFASSKWTGDFDKEFVGSLPKSVRSVSLNRAGYDQVDVGACNERGILISNTPGAVDDGTADVAMYLMLGAFRRSWVPSLAIRNGEFRGKTGLGHDPQGKVLGIIGMGGIGKTLAKRALAFDMTIQYHNRNKLSPEPANTKWVPLDELLRTSDVISIHTPLTFETYHLLSHAQFSQMKDGVIIVNTARGPVIDEQALVDALESGKVFSAGLDVYEHEPRVHEGLLGNENVVLYPHLGTFTFESQMKMEKLVVENLRKSIVEGKLVTGIAEQRGL